MLDSVLKDAIRLALSARAASRFKYQELENVLKFLGETFKQIDDIGDPLHIVERLGVYKEDVESIKGVLLGQEYDVVCRVCKGFFKLYPSSLDGFHRPIFTSPPEHEFPDLGKTCAGGKLPAILYIMSESGEIPDYGFSLPTGIIFFRSDWEKLAVYVPSTSLPAIESLNKLSDALSAKWEETEEERVSLENEMVGEGSSLLSKKIEDFLSKGQPETPDQPDQME